MESKAATSTSLYRRGVQNKISKIFDESSEKLLTGLKGIIQNKERMLNSSLFP